MRSLPGKEPTRSALRRFRGIVGNPVVRTLVFGSAVFALCASWAAADAPPVTESAEPAIITTLAGGGSVGDGGSALAARLHLPGGVLATEDGDWIVVDFGNHRVRRVDHRTGRIETLAGTGEAGFNGDGIPAARAQLSRPEYAILGPDGSLYIADSYNNRIRRIDAETAIITTVAGSGKKGFSGDGGPATEADLHYPEGITMDAEGNLFIGDMVNRRIRRVDAETGIITTFAGTGNVGTSPSGTLAVEADFLRLARLATDAAGNIYVADSPSHTIQRIDRETGRLETLVGTGTLGFSGDGGPATEARISFPEGILVAPNGDLYFGDVGNHRVRRRVASTGRIETVAGTGKHGFSGDGGPATLARLWSPGRLALDAEGNLLVADIGNLRVRRVAKETGLIETVVGSGDLGDGGPAEDALLSVPGDLAHFDGLLYIADYGNRRIRRVDLETGRIETVAGGGGLTGTGIPAVEAELILPEGIAVDEGSLYIADSSAQRVWRVDLRTGLMHHFAGTGRQGFSGDGGPAVEAELNLPSALGIDPEGRVLVADFGNRRTRAIDPKTGRISSLGSSSRYIRSKLDRSVVSLEIRADDIFRIVSENPWVVERLNLERHVVEELSLVSGVSLGDSGRSAQVVDVALHENNLFAADALGHQVLRMDLDSGRVDVLAGSGAEGFSGDGGPAARASLFQPGAVAVGEGGRTLFIADAKNHRVRQVTLAPPEPNPEEPNPEK